MSFIFVLFYFIIYYYCILLYFGSTHLMLFAYWIFGRVFGATTFSICGQFSVLPKTLTYTPPHAVVAKSDVHPRKIARYLNFLKKKNFLNILYA